MLHFDFLVAKRGRSLGIRGATDNIPGLGERSNSLGLCLNGLLVLV